MVLLAVVFLISIWESVRVANGMPQPVAGLNPLVEKLRFGSGKGGGKLQFQEMSSKMITTTLPDSPFIQLRSEPDSPSASGSAVNPKVLKLRQGQSAVLRCEVLGMPAPVAYWTKNGVRMLGDEIGNDASDLGQGGNIVETLANSGRPTLEHAATVAKLKLSCAKPSDAGLYQCNGDNGVEKVVAYTRVIVEPAEGPESTGDESTGTDCPAADEAAAPILSKPPFIYMYTDMRLEYPGNNAQLACRAEGHPPPAVRWYDSSETPIRNGQNFTILPNGDLLVRRIDFGIHQPFRQFICQAVNTIGDDKAAVDLLAISRAK